MNKRWLIVTIDCLVIIAIIGVGGKVYMDKKTEQFDRKMTTQKNLALFLVQNYEGVKKIEFHEFEEVKGLGYTSWSVTVNVNDNNVISFTMEDPSKVEDASIRHNPKTFHLKEQDKNLSKGLDDVEIIYWEES